MIPTHLHCVNTFIDFSLFLRNRSNFTLTIVFYTLMGHKIISSPRFSFLIEKVASFAFSAVNKHTIGTFIESYQSFRSTSKHRLSLQETSDLLTCLCVVHNTFAKHKEAKPHLFKPYQALENLYINRITKFQDKLYIGRSEKPYYAYIPSKYAIQLLGRFLEQVFHDHHLTANAIRLDKRDLYDDLYLLPCTVLAQKQGGRWQFFALQSKRIITFCSEGGLSTQKMALCLKTGEQHFVKKVTKSESDTGFFGAIAAAFSRFDSLQDAERKALTTLDGKNITPTLQACIDIDHSTYFISDYISGPTLEMALDHVHLTKKERKVLALLFLGQVVEMHKATVFHEDLKPANILVKLSPNEAPYLEVKLIDFGFSSTHCQTTNVYRGTAMYMHPKLVQKDRSTPESTTSLEKDYFSTACILYEIFTGEKFLERDFVRKGADSIFKNLIDKVNGSEMTKSCKKVVLALMGNGDITDAIEYFADKVPRLTSKERGALLEKLQMKPDAPKTTKRKRR